MDAVLRALDILDSDDQGSRATSGCDTNRVVVVLTDEEPCSTDPQTDPQAAANILLRNEALKSPASFFVYTLEPPPNAVGVVAGVGVAGSASNSGLFGQLACGTKGTCKYPRACPAADEFASSRD